MKTEIRNFRISVSEPTLTSCPWDHRAHNRYTVTVMNKDNGKRTRFYFYASIANPEIDSEKELLEAFDCFLLDCNSGAMGFDDFCSEVGYDEDSMRAKKTWRACVRAAKNFQRIGGDLEGLWDLINEIGA